MGGAHTHRHIGDLRTLKRGEGNVFTDNSIGLENRAIVGSKKPKTLAGYGRISFDIYREDSGGPALITCFYFRQPYTSTKSYTHYSFMNVGPYHKDEIFDDLPKNLYVYTPTEKFWENIEV